MKGKGRTGVIAALLLGGQLTLAAGTGIEAAEATVKDLHESLLAVMNVGEQLDFSQRVERLRPVVRRTHHFVLITRLMLGRHARDLDERQLAAVADALAAFSVAEYARHFDSYNGEQLHHVKTTEQGNDRVSIATELIKSNGDPVQLDYLLQLHDGKWGIVNVIADGVSDLALKRGEYAPIVTQDGYQALVERLHEQSAEFGR